MSGDEQRVSLVTGGAGGIGRAIAEALAGRGDRVAVLDVDHRAATEVAQSLPSTMGQRHLGLRCDLRSETSVSAAFESAERELGGLHTLVNSGGVREIVDVVRISVAQWREVIEVNLTGTFLTCREFAVRVARRRDAAPRSIVNIASVAGLVGISSRPAYSASKHGVIGLSKNLSTDLARYGIRVNVVAPGTIRTPMTEGYFADEGFVSSLSAVVPLGAAGTVRDVAAAVDFLTGAGSGFVTGAVLAVDGGWSAEKSYSADPGSAYFAGANGTAEPGPRATVP
ncbi:SDR family NAD(P)-dependent oxidoreductase [Streptomyces sp. KR55]|uniref:SDR family NAD(P)-dependent oxidoreductase n=1 Tax=Streptomyces sp. KR55 TaxID=3457425 RepID=UPI003FD1B29B